MLFHPLLALASCGKVAMEGFVSRVSHYGMNGTRGALSLLEAGPPTSSLCKGQVGNCAGGQGGGGMGQPSLLGLSPHVASSSPRS